MLGKYVFITPQKSELKNFHRKFCLSKQEVFRKLPVLFGRVLAKSLQLELDEFAPGLESLEFVSGECSSRIYLF